MQVGDLIDKLEPFRGRGDTVYVWDEEFDVDLKITEVSWDSDNHVVFITVGTVGTM